MPRLACVNLPELPLQLAIRAHPEWQDLPVVVLTEDRPTGIVLHSNRAAARAGVRRLMRYTSALALISTLRAAVIPEEEVLGGIAFVARRLNNFSPHVEPCAPERSRAALADRDPGASGTGVFWLDAGGLGYLYPSIEVWLTRIGQDLQSQGFRPRLAAGFTRGGTLVAARVARAASSVSPADAPPALVFATIEDEARFCREAALSALPLGPTARARLSGLGIRNVQDFLDLPSGGVRLRFGRQAGKLHELLSSPSALPLQPLEQREEMVIHRKFDREVADTPTLLDAVEQALEILVQDVARVGARVVEIILTLTHEDGSEQVEHIRPSEPTATHDLLRGLVRLRVESVLTPLAAPRGATVGVIGFALRVDRTGGVDGQIGLTGLDPSEKRDRAAGERAFAMIRAELGNDAVRQVRLQSEHPPERQYGWENPGPLAALRAAAGPGRDEPGTLVRRIYELPAPMRGFGALSRRARGCGGPYVISGAWWATPFDREYRFIETQDGAVLWIFRDRTGGVSPGGHATWMLQGMLA